MELQAYKLEAQCRECFLLLNHLLSKLLVWFLIIPKYLCLNPINKAILPRNHDITIKTRKSVLIHPEKSHSSQILPVTLHASFIDKASSSKSHNAFSCFVSFHFFSLECFHHFLWICMTLTLLKIAGYFVECFLSMNLSDISSWLRSD